MGNDFINAGTGADTVKGGAGHDTIPGGLGRDLIFGGDTLIGGQGDDQITGGALGDLVFGGDGDDFLNGGFGFDRMNGGAGADRFFHLGVMDHGSDWVQDFGTDDTLAFGVQATAQQFQINRAFTAQAGADDVAEAFVTYRPTGQILWALVDGGALDSVTLRIGGAAFDLMG